MDLNDLIFWKFSVLMCSCFALLKNSSLLTGNITLYVKALLKQMVIYILIPLLSIKLYIPVEHSISKPIRRGSKNVCTLVRE